MQPVRISAGERREKAAVSELKTTEAELRAHSAPGPSGSRLEAAQAGLLPRRPKAWTSKPEMPETRAKGKRQENFRE